MLTPEEYQCYRIAQTYRRKHLLMQLVSIHRIFWPKILGRIAWANSWWRLGLQLLLLALLWPVLVIWGLTEYILQLLKSPVHLLGTYKAPNGVRSPGEKSLVGIHNAFQDVLDLPEDQYIGCIDDWLDVLFGAERETAMSLESYVDREKDRQSEPGISQFEMAEQLRCKIAVARESLSRDLGHYLAEKP